MPAFIHLLLSLALLLAACSQDDARSKPEPRTIKAQTMRLALTEARECRSLPGQVESRNSVILASKTSGTVTEILAREGDVLTAGQAILRIDDAELRQREQSMRATAGQAGLEGKALAARKAQAKATLERMQKLLRQAAVSRDDVDRAQAEYEALANQEKAMAAQSSAAGFQSAEIRALMQYSTVTSPLNGVLTRRHVDLGAFVQAGTPLAEVDDLKSGFELVAQADESLLGRIEQGMNVVALIPSLSEAPFLTTLSAVIGQVDPASRSFRIKAALDATPSPGMYGKVCVPVGTARKLLVPRSALRPRGELTTALIVDSDSTLRLRIVKIGGVYQKAVLGGKTFILQTGTDQFGAVPEGAEILVEVLSGLSPDDEVVLSAPAVAREGDLLVRE
ncbi:RND family efflux transporter MFP subunit [Desulfomicrobium macestii]|uniref:RND family efflux transporter MFP subunit n=1 Tax=Desulfomicrobium macestii TaxID=90731 RepID=A0ABR9GZU3_9BACT|nr:efflux RND transporter periplasmic adaptor subunit [Desulfomicrobium macestii]MBE1423981.1 RND family efflux transporter MFP subunit [Desulfomicrobium macestii]